MDSGAAPAEQHVRYEADDRPPLPITIGLGLQYALISVASVRLLLIAEGDAGRAELEFIAAMDDANLEDRMAMLTEGAAATPSEEELPLRLLRHYASSVRHQQYHDTDVVAVRVDASPSSRP